MLNMLKIRDKDTPGLLLCLLIICSIRVNIATFLKSEYFQTLPSIRMSDVNAAKVFDVKSSKFCVFKCFMNGCKVAEYNFKSKKCGLHNISLYEVTNLIEDADYELYYPTGSWKPIAKFSASNNGTYMGNNAFDVWNNPVNSVNTEICAESEETVKCDRHYVNQYKDVILGSKFVTKVKISLYEAGVEAAWVIFDKQPGSNDNWFQASRVVDSYPWDTELLRSSAEMSTVQLHNSDVKWNILQANNEFMLRTTSPHRYWMKLYEPSTVLPIKISQCEYGTYNVPLILFSKGPEPTLLSKSSVSYIAIVEGPGMNWTQAQTFCETHLKVPIAQYDEVDYVRINQPYQCCAYAWMDINGTGSIGYPMNDVIDGCSAAPGMQTQPNSPLNRVFCKPNTSIVGVADTMVISTFT